MTFSRGSSRSIVGVSRERLAKRGRRGGLAPADDSASATCSPTRMGAACISSVFLDCFWEFGRSLLLEDLQHVPDGSGDVFVESSQIISKIRLFTHSQRSFL